MKNKLLKLAKDSEFESTFLYNKPYKYSNKEELRYLLWLTELQDWLRLTHDFHVQPKVLYWSDRSYTFTLHSEKYYINADSRIDFTPYPDYKSALEAGIYCALSMLNSKQLNIGTNINFKLNKNEK